MISWLVALLACGGSGDLSGGGAAPIQPSDPNRPKLEVGTIGGGDVPGETAGELLSSADCDTITSDPVAKGGCVTGVIRCGETVLGNTVGGVDRYDTRFYEQYFCTPATSDHDSGGERIYELQLPEGDWHADITMETPCADLDLAALKFDGPGCPDKTSRIDICELNRQPKTKKEHVRIVSQGEPSRWLVIVEGEGEAEGAFGLKVECSPGL